MKRNNGPAARIGLPALALGALLFLGGGGFLGWQWHRDTAWRAESRFPGVAPKPGAPRTFEWKSPDAAALAAVSAEVTLYQDNGNGLRPNNRSKSKQAAKYSAAGFEWSSVLEDFAPLDDEGRAVPRTPGAPGPQGAILKASFDGAGVLQKLETGEGKVPEGQQAIVALMSAAGEPNRACPNRTVSVGDRWTRTLSGRIPGQPDSRFTVEHEYRFEGFVVAEGAEYARCTFEFDSTLANFTQSTLQTPFYRRDNRMVERVVRMRGELLVDPKTRLVVRTQYDGELQFETNTTFHMKGRPEPVVHPGGRGTIAARTDIQLDYPA